MVTSIRKRVLMIVALAFVVVAVMIAYSQQKPDEKLPVCECWFPNKKEYGVKKDGKCVVTKCQKKTPEKMPER